MLATFCMLCFGLIHLDNEIAEGAEGAPQTMEDAAEWVFSKGGTIGFTDKDDELVEVQDLEELPKDVKVTDLKIEDCQDLPIDEMACLKLFPDIKAISFQRNSAVTDEHLKHLVALKDLEVLNIAETSLTGSGFRHLKEMRKLNTIVCGGTPIKDIGLSHVAKISSLRLLGLVGTKVTDKGMDHLVGLKLNVLRLSHSNITDVGLKKLRSMKSLKEIVLVGTEVTPKGISAFQTAIPKCRIVK